VRSARAATPSPRQVEDPDRLAAAEVDDLDGDAALPPRRTERQRRGAAEHLKGVQIHPPEQRDRRAARGSCRRRSGGDTRPAIGAACRSSGSCAVGLLRASPAGRAVVRARGLVRWGIEPARSTLMCAAVGSRPEPRPPPAALPGHVPVSGRMFRSVGGARKRWSPQSGTAVAPQVAPSPPLGWAARRCQTRRCERQAGPSAPRFRRAQLHVSAARAATCNDPPPSRRDASDLERRVVLRDPLEG